MSDIQITLYRADHAADDQIARRGTWWAFDLEQARRYMAMPGFGGPHLYRATVSIDPARILDLRPDFWGVLRSEFGLHRDDYGAGELDHELVWQFGRNLLPAYGYDWAVLEVSHPSGVHDEWLHTGAEPNGLALRRSAGALPSVSAGRSAAGGLNARPLGAEPVRAERLPDA